MPVDALLLRRVTKLAPLSADFNSLWPHLTGLTLADPLYYEQHKIDLLLGGDVYGMLLLPGVQSGPVGTPTAQNTVLGWILSGPVSRHTSGNSANTPRTVNANVASLNCNIDDKLAAFWEIEEVSKQRVQTIDEETCENIFDTTFRRDESGRFHVRLPFLSGKAILGDSQRMAVLRQLQMEKRFSSNPEFAQQYRHFMAEYLSLGHMEVVADSDIVLPFPKHTALPSENTTYHIPHHAVMKASSTTTKLRVVFDASRESTNGLSLNEKKCMLDLDSKTT